VLDELALQDAEARDAGGAASAALAALAREEVARSRGGDAPSMDFAAAAAALNGGAEEEGATDDGGDDAAAGGEERAIGALRADFLRRAALGEGEPPQPTGAESTPPPSQGNGALAPPPPLAPPRLGMEILTLEERASFRAAAASGRLSSALGLAQWTPWWEAPRAAHDLAAAAARAGARESARGDGTAMRGGGSGGEGAEAGGEPAAAAVAPPPCAATAAAVPPAPPLASLLPRDARPSPLLAHGLVDILAA
jgi:hypothetical protein